jgi:hypothetical protein
MWLIVQTVMLLTPSFDLRAAGRAAHHPERALAYLGDSLDLSSSSIDLPLLLFGISFMFSFTFSCSFSVYPELTLLLFDSQNQDDLEMLKGWPLLGVPRGGRCQQGKEGAPARSEEHSAYVTLDSVFSDAEIFHRHRNCRF